MGGLSNSLPFLTMHIDQDRFGLTDTENARIDTFEDYIWYNSEVCNHCFSRVRDIEVNPSAARLSGTSLKNHPATFYERTEIGSQEHHDWDYNQRFGTCFCLDCGGDLTAAHLNLGIEQLLDYAENLCRYVRDETPLQIDPNRFARELGEYKRTPRLQGRDSQMFAAAFARSLQTRAKNVSAPYQPAD